MDMQERYPMEIFKQNWCFEANLNFLIQMLCGESWRNSNTEISRERRLSGVGTGNASSLHLHNTQTFTSANTLSYFPSAYTKIPLRSWLLPKNILLLLKSHPPPNGNNIWDSPDSAEEETLRQILDLIGSSVCSPHKPQGPMNYTLYIPCDTFCRWCRLIKVN